MAGFNWEYFGVINFDPTALYREVLLLPILIVVLWFLWMSVVKSTQETGLPCQAMDIGEVYQEAVIQDALSTDDEVDSGAENEPPASKEDLNEKEEDAKKDD